jgi:ATP/maltotriose-dependent transcriptional regulator MalT
MSVFAGGCNLESAEAVTTETGGAKDRPADLLEIIASLVDKNLVRQAEGIGSRARFGMLETIREFGIEMLAECGDLDFAQRRHAEHFLLLAEEASENIPGPDQEHWLQTLEQEHDNLRAALRWSILHDEAAGAMRMAAALEQFWQFRGYILEGHGWLEAVLEADRSGAITLVRAKALTSLGMLELYRSDYDGAQRSHEQALAIYRAIDDQWNAAIAVNDLGTVALYRSDYPAARRLFGESLELRRRIGDLRGSAVCLTNLGIVAQVQGDLQAARGHHERSLELRRQLGDAAGIARSLTRLGAVATEQHDHSAAQGFLLEALTLSREEGDDRATAASLSALGAVAVDLGKVSEAKELLEESLTIRRRIGDRSGILRSLWHLLKIAEAEGDLDRARSLWEEGLPIQHETADRRGMALWLAGLGDLLVRQGDYETAKSHYERSLVLRHHMGDEQGAAVILGRLAQMSLRKGDAGLARRQLQDSVEGLRGADDAQALTAALTNLAQIVAGLGDIAESESLYKEALSLQHGLDNLQVIVLCLSGLALSAHAQGDRERAARLKGAVSGLRSAFDTPVNTAELHHVSDAIDLDLQDPGISKAWASGQALTTQESVAYALSDAAATEDRNETATLPDGLSEREAEVLALMATGRSNPEIAAELFISVNTVYRHVSHIFVKTGTSNRVEAATYARSHGLPSTVSDPA